MDEIIKDTSILASAAEPLEFLTETGIDKEEGEGIVKRLKDALDGNRTIVALSAPQIGVGKRVFCIRFNDAIKTFINPIVIKKSDYQIRPETFASMPGKEILITRPEDVTVVYYTDEFKYEENRLLKSAARIFDQQCQLLDGILPSDLGLVSDIEEDGQIADCSEDELAQLIEIYKQFIAAKVSALQGQISESPELEKEYQSLKFAEKVINGEATVIGKDATKAKNAASASAALSLKALGQGNRLAQRNQMLGGLKKKRKM